MQAFRDLSNKRKLTLSSVATSVVVLVLASIAIAVHEYEAFRDDTIGHLESMAFIVGYNCTVTLTFEDSKAAELLLSALEKEPHIAAAAIYDAKRVPFAVYTRDNIAPKWMPLAPRADGHYIEEDGLGVFAPIHYEGERLGTIFLLSDTEVLNAELRDIGMMILLVLAVSLLLSYLISAKLQAVVSEPVIHLAQTVRAITNKRDYELRAMPAGRDEIGFLVDAFNRMLDDLQREMTDRLAAETALQQNEEKLAADRLRVLAETVGAAAHEINQPLNGIVGRLELMIMDDDIDDARRAELKSTLELVIRISDIVRQMQQARRYVTKSYTKDKDIIDIEASARND